jgi:23S rRNA (cytidine1920-2'-O)/16S rRNA (cytidine1409-2'-O)-methyltransferase
VKKSSPKKRLDVLLVERGLTESRQRAQAVILAGQVRVNEQLADKAGSLVPVDAAVEIMGQTLRYVSRGGLKLEGALEEFAVSPAGLICLDVGSSTGGFTDCLLQHGAARVYAADVTTSQLDWKLRSDARVICVTGNVRYLSLAPNAGEAGEGEILRLARDDNVRTRKKSRGGDRDESVDAAASNTSTCALAERPALITADLSFISVAKVLPRLVGVAATGALFLILVKPQFELERGDVGRGGIVRDPALHSRAVENVSTAAVAAGLEVIGVKPSRVLGAEGNQEFFLCARFQFSPARN